MNKQQQKVLEEKAARLEDENSKQADRIRELESQLYKLQLGGEGIGVGVEAIIERADQDRQRLEATIKDLQSQNDAIFTYLPKQVIFLGHNLHSLQLPSGKTLANTAVGISIFFSNGQGYQHTVIDNQVYTGDYVAAKNDIVGAIYAALDKSPKLEDLGNQVIEGLTSDEIIEICKGLAQYKYLKLSSSFEQERKKAFDLLAERLEAAQYPMDRNSIRTNFNQTINRTFKRYEDRWKATIREVPIHTIKQKTVLDRA